MSAGQDDTTLPPTQLERAGTPAPSPKAPARLGRYEILSELARGGMGVVYIGRDPDLGREVAIKQCLPPRVGGSATQAEEQQRFQREARAVAQLQHPHIVSIFDVSKKEGADDASYFVMELIRGESLQDRLRREGPLPERDVAKLGVQLAQALEYAHGRGILHRDLKPHNVLLSEDGEPHLTDFGLAKVADLRDLETRDDPSLRAALPNLSGEGSLTLTGQLLGTPAYMPPEQAEGRTIDARADVYGLGATLYALLAGRPPHQAGTLLNTLAAVLTQDVSPPSRERAELDPALEAIVLRCLERDPDARYATCRELTAALAAWLKAPRGQGSSSKGLAPLVGGLAIAALAVGLGVASRGDRTGPGRTQTVAAKTPSSKTPSTSALLPPPGRTLTPTPKPSRTVAPKPTPSRTVAPQPTRLRLEESFTWSAPLLHPWRRGGSTGTRQYVLVGRGPDCFIRVIRGPGLPPVWVFEGERVKFLRGQRFLQLRVALASPQLVLRNIRGRYGMGQLFEVDSGKVRLKELKRRGADIANTAMSDAWVVQAFKSDRGWQVVARSTSADPAHTKVFKLFPNVRSITSVLVGSRLIGMHDLKSGELYLYRMPTRERMSELMAGPDPQPDRVNPERVAPQQLEGKAPLAISPKDDYLVLRLPKGRGIQLIDVRSRRSHGWLQKATCAGGPGLAQFSPDGKYFAWIDGTVHVIAVADPKRRVSVPKQAGWVAFFWHADTSITVLTTNGVRRFELVGE